MSNECQSYTVTGRLCEQLPVTVAVIHFPVGEVKLQVCQAHRSLDGRYA